MAGKNFLLVQILNNKFGMFDNKDRPKNILEGLDNDNLNNSEMATPVDVNTRLVMGIFKQRN